MSKRLKHAIHNESACHALLNLKGEKYYDWVVTTAFYSCIHFVEHKIFPITEVGRVFNTFNEYYNFSRRQNPKKAIDKHTFKNNLVKKYLHPVAADYGFLLTQCMTSRYSEYQISEGMAKMCVKKMTAIKTHCTS